MRKVNRVVLMSVIAVFSICLMTAQLAAQNYETKPGTRYRGPAKAKWSDQAVAYNFALARIATESEEFTEKLRAGEQHKQLTNIVSNARFLKNRWSTWITRNGSEYAPGRDRYLEDLKHNFDLLTRARKTDNIVERDEFIDIVNMDMQIKADNCRNAGDGLGKTVVVKVSAKKDAAAVPGYQIWYVPRGLYSVKAEHDHFNKITNPTETIHLPPGGYLMWGVKDDAGTKPAVYRIGGKGLTEVEIDLIIP